MGWLDRACASAGKLSPFAGDRARVYDDPVRVLKSIIRRLTRTSGGDQDGSSGATSTMAKCSLAAGVA
jgi:hypothetical protein